MGATLKELARGIHGNADRAESKRLAKLHGHNWKALRKALKRVHRDKRRISYEEAIRMKYSPENVEAHSGWATRVLERMRHGS